MGAAAMLLHPRVYWRSVALGHHELGLGGWLRVGKGLDAMIGPSEGTWPRIHHHHNNNNKSMAGEVVLKGEGSLRLRR